MATDPVAAPCRRDYTAVHSSGTRPLTDIKWVVLHDEEAVSAVSAARYFENPASGGSAHICVDGQACYRTLPNEAVAWGAPGANLYGFHIEQAGYAKWSAVIWGRHLGTLRRAAYKAAFHCVLFGLPPDFLTAPLLLQGHKGITTHAECTKAFGPVNGHTDPGPFWPRSLFMVLVRRYYRQLEGGNL